MEKKLKITKKTTRRSIIALTVLAVTLLSCSAKARKSGYSVYAREFSFQVETENGPLKVLSHKGKEYIEGNYGQNYSIRVFNHTRNRVEAVVTVDGRDVVSGRKGDYVNERGYIIPPYGSTLIEGFRAGYDDVAQFFFTEAGDSYSASYGTIENTGVIGVAIFKEKKVRPRRLPPIVKKRQSHGESRSNYRKRSRGKSSSYPSASTHADEAGSLGMSDSYAPRMKETMDMGNMGTGYGETKYSPVEESVFKRKNSHRPNTVMSLYYDDTEGLVARGILPRPCRNCRNRHSPKPFPESDRKFAPPPPCYNEQ